MTMINSNLFFQSSELIEVVGSIFRKMCEMPEEYPYCLNICLYLSSNSKTTPHVCLTLLFSYYVVFIY